MVSVIIPNINIIHKDVKNTTLKVTPKGVVTLTTPLDSTAQYIQSVIKKRKSWIEERLTFYKENYREQIKEYVSGENVKYLGKNYRLKVIESDLETVKLQRGYLTIYVSDVNDFENKENLIGNWYKMKATAKFSKAIEKYNPIVNIEIKNIRIRKMKTRWGSCNASKSYINLNINLIEKATQCIEYVVFHELSHLVHPNHSPEFYNYMSTYMPDWKVRKEKLEQVD